MDEVASEEWVGSLPKEWGDIPGRDKGWKLGSVDGV